MSECGLPLARTYVVSATSHARDMPTPRHALVVCAALLVGHVTAHGHMLTPSFRKTMAVGKQIRGYYTYYPFANYGAVTVQGHTFGSTSFRCKDMAADSPSSTLYAGSHVHITTNMAAFHPGGARRP